MQRSIAIVLIVLAMVTSSLAKDKAPVGDWQAVQQDIPRGWGLEVVTSMTFPCVFQRATSDELVCTPLQRGKESDDAEIHVRRERIREIRVEKREGANMLAGGGTGAGLGALLGAALFPGGTGRAAFALGLGGGSIGARHGRDIHILRGKVIYRRAAPAPEERVSTKASRGESNSQKEQNTQETSAAAYSIVQTLP